MEIHGSKHKQLGIVKKRSLGATRNIMLYTYTILIIPFQLSLFAQFTGGCKADRSALHTCCFVAYIEHYLLRNNSRFLKLKLICLYFDPTYNALKILIRAHLIFESTRPTSLIKKK